MGMYHFGHLKALLETDCLPHIISGTSAGSIIGAMACTMTDDELAAVLTPEIIAPRIMCFESSLADRAGLLYREGVIFDKDEWMRIIRWFTCEDMTFEVGSASPFFHVPKKPPLILLVASSFGPGGVQEDGPGPVHHTDGHDEEGAAGASQLHHGAERGHCERHLGQRGAARVREAGLSALELYLKLMMKAKMKFVNELEAAVGFTGTLMTQEHEGSTTIVPQAHLVDYFKLMSDPSVTDMEHYFQGGAIAAYEKCAMMRLHNEVSLALGECIQLLESGGGVEGALVPIELPPHKNRRGI